MRRAFNLMMALVMILTLSGAAALLMYYLSISAHHKVDTYLREQAQIFMQSVIEATILKIEGYDRKAANKCLGNEGILRFVSPDRKFIAEVNVTRYYLFDGKDNDGDNNYCGSLTYAIDTRRSHGYVIIEAVVEGNMTHPKLKNFAAPLRITERVLQRP